MPFHPCRRRFPTSVSSATRHAVYLAFLSLLLLVLAACDYDVANPATLPASTVAPAASVAPPAATIAPSAAQAAATPTPAPTPSNVLAIPTAPAGKELFVLNLDNHMDLDLYDDFYAATGITVTEATYALDDDLYDALQSAASNIDLIVASRAANRPA